MAPPIDVLVEISSDEEDSILPDFVTPDVWPDDLFNEDDDAIGEDLDDLIIMSELSSPPVPKKTAKPDNLVIMSDLPSRPVLQKTANTDVCTDEDDNDCVVLDGDPDKAVTVADEERSTGEASSDELQIVAEKGPVACRDFPHSRHLCSNLPFGTTLHVKYCNMCHCFVCDAPAPCNYWGNGTALHDHCHATDKEKKWKTLRQAFKCKSLPASVPGEPLAYKTVPSRQQAMQCQVAVPQPPFSSVSNVGNPSLANRGPLVNEPTQNQRRHPSVRLSVSLAGPISPSRAGRGACSPHIAQNTHSHAVFKRVGGVSPGLTTANANRLGFVTAQVNSLMDQAFTHVTQPVPIATITNTFTSIAQNNLPQRSFSLPTASHAQLGQQAAYYQVPSNGMNVLGPQLSRCTSLTTQRTQRLPEPVADISTSSWEEVLASVASDLGVTGFNVGTPQSQHVMTDSGSQHAMTDSGPMCSTANQGLGLQLESVAAAGNLPTTAGMHDFSCHTPGGTVQAGVPIHTADNMCHLPYQSSLVPDQAHLNAFVPAAADKLPIGAAPEPEMPRFDSANIQFELDWE